MTEPQVQDNTTFTSEPTEKTAKAWITPSFQRIPLNEAEASHINNTANDGIMNYS